MSELEQLLDRLEKLLEAVDGLEGDTREQVFELLDGIDEIHRMALHRLADAVGAEPVARAGADDPAVAWLLYAYGVGVDQRASAEAALERVRPYVESHGGTVEVLAASAQGIVSVRLSGNCSGCTSSHETLREGVESALREGMAGFRGIEVEQADAPAHAPPRPTLLQISPRPPDTSG